MRRLHAILAAAAAVVMPVGAMADGQLNFYNWSDYIAEDTIPNFEAKTGTKVNYDVYDSNDVLEAKLLAGNSGYDLVVPTAMPALGRLIKAGAVQKLDKSKIPNLANLDPELMDRVRSADPNLEYAAIWQWGTNGIGINVDKVTERLGEMPTDTFDLLFKPEVVAKLADCGVTILDSADEVMPLVMNYLGYEPFAEDPKALKAAEDLMMKIRPHVRYFHSSRYINDLANGEVCVSNGFSGDIFIAASRAEEAGNNITIEYKIPREGSLIWFDVMTIPAGAPNLDNAHAFINYALEPEVMAGITNYVWYANAVPASMAMVDEEVRNNPSIFPTEEVKKKLFSAKLFSPKFTRELTRAWTKVRTGE
ncbi:MAG: polyamine ABC transporter substrate-binding protein [Pseudomonadota bacterium]|nr:polyamine ABC transporter substrate-binding protein [Pseudomonadota bacterium]